MQPIPCYESDPEGIQAAYTTTFPFIKCVICCHQVDMDRLSCRLAHSDVVGDPRCVYRRDGLLFYMKAAHYEMDLSPLALVWKDHHTSRYFVYTEKPSIVLRLDGAREFTTLEGIALNIVDDTFILQHEVRLRRF